MKPAVAVVVERFMDGRSAYQQNQGNPVAVLQASRGGPLERGYPKNPNQKEKALDEGAQAQVRSPCRAEGGAVSVLISAAPILVVSIGALLLMLSEAFGKPTAPEGFGPGGIIVDAGAGRSSELGLGAPPWSFSSGRSSASPSGWWVPRSSARPISRRTSMMDRFALFFCFVLCLGGGLAALLAGGYLPEHNIDRAEFFPLLLFSTVGAMALAAAGDLLTLFVALETMSLGVYSMIGLRRGSPRASEAALKYFLLGSFAAALMLFGGAPSTERPGTPTSPVSAVV